MVVLPVILRHPTPPTIGCYVRRAKSREREDRQVEERPLRPTGYQISLVPQSVPNIVNCSRNLVPRPAAVMQHRGIRSRDTSQTSPMEMPCKLAIVLFFPPAHWGIERFDDHTIRWLMNGATTSFENRFFADGRLVGCCSLPFSLYWKSNESRRERQRCIGDYKIKAFQNIVLYKAVLTGPYLSFLNYSSSTNQSRILIRAIIQHVHALLVYIYIGIHIQRNLIDGPIIALISKWKWR